MVEFLLNGFLNALLVIVNILTYPINLLISSVIPNSSGLISSFNNMINNYVLPNVGYFFSLLPPVFKNTLFIFITFSITYYTFYFTFLAFVWVWHVIQKIKFW